jgi:hypothetical protein
MNAKEWKLAENMTTQISRKNLLQCPECMYISGEFERGPKETGNRQTLTKLGDSEHKLFCPHCEIIVTLLVSEA